MDEHWLERNGRALTLVLIAVLVSLFTTVTYRAELNQHTTATHRVGSPIMATHHPTAYLLYMVCCSTALFAAYSVVLLGTVGLPPLRERDLLQVMRGLQLVALIALVLAYLIPFAIGIV